MYEKIIAVLTCLSFFLPISNVSASEMISPNHEEVAKKEIVELFPEKFKNLDISELSLGEVQARAGTHSQMVMNGVKKEQDHVFLTLFQGAGWATSEDGSIDLTLTKTISVKMATSYKWDSGAAVEASVSYSKSAAVTHHVKAYKGKICTLGVFGRVTAEEYTLYVYDNYTNQLLSSSKGTVRYVTGQYYEGVYDGQKVKKFYNKDYTIKR